MISSREQLFTTSVINYKGEITEQMPYTTCPPPAPSLYDDVSVIKTSLVETQFHYHFVAIVQSHNSGSNDVTCFSYAGLFGLV